MIAAARWILSLCTTIISTVLSSIQCLPYCIQKKEGPNPQQQKTDPNITGSKNSLNVPGHLLFPHIRKTPPGVNHGKEVTVQTFPIFFGVASDVCYVFFGRIWAQKQKEKKGNNRRICKFLLASASSWLTRLIIFYKITSKTETQEIQLLNFVHMNQK